MCRAWSSPKAGNSLGDCSPEIGPLDFAGRIDGKRFEFCQVRPIWREMGIMPKRRFVGVGIGYRRSLKECIMAGAEYDDGVEIASDQLLIGRGRDLARDIRSPHADKPGRGDF